LKTFVVKVQVLAAIFIFVAKYRMPNAIEKYKSPVGDGNGFKPACEVKTGTIEKYKSPVGDGNPYAIFNES